MNTNMMQLGVTTLALLVVTTHAVGEEATHPLEPGTELLYRIHDSFDSGSVADADEWTAHVYAVRKREDGTLVVVTLFKTTSESRLDRLSLTPDGVVQGLSLNRAFLATNFFPPLSKTGVVTTRGLFLFETTRHGPGTLRIKVQGPHHRALEIVQYNDIALSSGVVKSVEITAQQKRAFRHRSVTKIALQKTRRRERAWMDQFAAESDRYFRAVLRYERIMLEQRTTTAEWAGKARTLLTELNDNVSLKPVRECVGSLLRQHDRRTKTARALAAKEGKLRGRVVQWEARDLKGRRHSMARYKGKPVVLDFWFRECGYCLDVMDQMRDLDLDEAVLLSVSKDRDRRDAKLVATAMGLETPVLFRSELPRLYGIQSYPTILVVDSKGMVVDARIGYSPVIAEWLRRSVKTARPR